MIDCGVCILGGGEASRLPGKLEADFEGTPLIVRVFENVSAIYPVYISTKGTFRPDVDARLRAPMIVDRWSERGPLAGLISVFSEVSHERMFVVAGDAPFADARALQMLGDAWQAGDDAVVAEPLLALYGRAAFLDAAWPVFTQGRAGVKDVIAKMRARTVALPITARTNINTPADLQHNRKYEEVS
ncbi:MAG: molybdenum cofactor guanylyltransferase [Candidatus Eremiobacteraeota bacterium]|nr:molybdenum cofactor guanylyltransferase [Candidatus Eremiobacteraeota bacterium]